MITRKELLMGRDTEYPLDLKTEQHLKKLLTAVNFLQVHYWPKPMIVTSGYRPGHYNKTAGGAEHSAHLTCEAIDIRDSDGKLCEFLLYNQSILVQCNLYMESPDQTKGWCHLQTRPTINRVFKK